MASHEHQYNLAAPGTPAWSWRLGNPAPPSSTRLSTLVEMLFVPLALVLAAYVSFFFDCQISQWCHLQLLPGDVKKLLSIGEIFSHGLGVAFIAIAIYRLDRERRRLVPKVLAASIGAGMTANVVKLVIGRMRPRAFDFQGDVWTTFTSAFPMHSEGWAGQSFPSAHVAVAAALALVLGRMYPQAKWFFVVLAVLAAGQRVYGGAHYVSDVLVGAAVGIVFARTILSTKWCAISPAKKMS